MTTKYLWSGTLSFGKLKIIFSHKDVETHSLCSGFTKELFIARVYPETIMMMKQWSRNAFLWYIHIQVSNLSKGIITLITNNQAFYTIPEAEIFYHMPRQDKTTPNHIGWTYTKEDDNIQLLHSLYSIKMISKEVTPTPLIIESE